jgi:hypothetical protein
MGATAYYLGLEVPEFAAVNDTEDGPAEGNFPAVQLLTDAGAPVKITSWSDADTEPAGNVRIGDWEYLSNGNILIVGSDRQAIEQTRLDAPATSQPVFKIVTADNVEVKGLTLASSTTDTSGNDIWHGAAVTQNGFAIRGAHSLRFFDNTGTALGPDVDVAALTGDPAYARSGDRGEAVGFHGNGKDAYVLATAGTDLNGVKGIFVTVFNADGTLRWATNATVGFTLNSPGRTDAAIDAQGRVFVVFDDVAPTLDGDKTVQGRFLDNTGKAISSLFLVSDKETGGSDARASWRGDTVAVTWQSQNAFMGSPDPVPNPEVVALRLFTLASSGDIVASVSASGGNITITWTGGTGPFTVQKKTTLTDAQWSTAGTTPNRTITLPASGNTGFFRVAEGL